MSTGGSPSLGPLALEWPFEGVSLVSPRAPIRGSPATCIHVSRAIANEREQRVSLRRKSADQGVSSALLTSREIVDAVPDAGRWCCGGVLTSGVCLFAPDCRVLRHPAALFPPNLRRLTR